MMRRAALACLVVSGACAGTGEGGGDPPPGETAAERCAAWIEEALAVTGTGRDDIRAQLGEPTEVSATTEPNRHIPDATDSLFTVTYPGIVFSLRKPPEGGDLLERAHVTDNAHLLWTDPGIGASAERVIEVLGEPAEREPDLLHYACGSGPVNEPAFFVLRDSVVQAVIFDFYVD